MNSVSARENHISWLFQHYTVSGPLQERVESISTLNFTPDPHIDHPWDVVLSGLTSLLRYGINISLTIRYLKKYCLHTFVKFRNVSLGNFANKQGLLSGQMFRQQYSQLLCISNLK